MSIPSTRNAASPNLVGTAAFLSYILAALVLSARVVYRIRIRHRSSLSLRDDSKQQGRFKVSAALAGISFCVLSFNMVDVLICSYLAYCQHSHKPASLAHVPSQLWSWMIGSNLFHDFARALLATEQSWWWIQLALLIHLHLSIWMAQTSESLIRLDLQLNCFCG